MDSTNIYQHQLIQLQVAGYPFLTGISAIQDWNPSMTSEEEYYNYYKGREELWKRNIDTYSSIKMPIHQDGHQKKDMNGLNDNSFKESYFKHHAFDLNENFMSQDFYIKNAKTCNGFFGTSNCISSHREYSNFQDPKFSFNGIMYKNSGDSISITGLQELIHSPSNKRSIVSNNIGVRSKAKRLNYSAEAPSQEPSKKSGVTSHSSSPMLKVRKEKLGDRISALHRLVAPFGKTDTASVLTEAIGYIQFLQDQIHRFSMPYTKSLNGKFHQINLMESSIDMKGRAVLDLKSRGLCLVPISLSCYITTSCDGNI